MTTNVYDKNIPKLASDSRWSIDSEHVFRGHPHTSFVLYVDDTGYDKIEFCSSLGAAFMFAGDGGLIQKWKDWLTSDLSTPRPNTDNALGFAICVVDVEDAQIVLESRQSHTLPDARFTGTGGIYAYNCWVINKDPCRAVESAIKADMYSGGSVLFFNLNSGENNLKNSASMNDAMRLMQQEGHVMYKQNQNSPIPVQQAASNDDNVQLLLNQIASGSVTPCAPFEGMDTPWTKEENMALDAALEKLINRKKNRDSMLKDAR